MESNKQQTSISKCQDDEIYFTNIVLKIKNERNWQTARTKCIEKDADIIVKCPDL